MTAVLILVDAVHFILVARPPGHIEKKPMAVPTR